MIHDGTGERPLNDTISVELSLFVEHGREQEAADFYTAAFGARQVDIYAIEGVPVAVQLLLGSLPLSVVGSNPKREQQPSHGGPFFPKKAGAVSAILRLNVNDLDGAMQKAVSAGAAIRDPVQADGTGRRIASVFDPFGHIWGLAERTAKEVRQAA